MPEISITRTDDKIIITNGSSTRITVCACEHAAEDMLNLLKRIPTLAVRWLWMPEGVPFKYG